MIAGRAVAPRRSLTAVVALTMLRQQRRLQVVRPLLAAQKIEQAMARQISTLLRTGVFLAAALVTMGAAAFLLRYGTSLATYSAFKGEPDELRNVQAIVRTSWSGDGRAMIQLGLLVLLATPVARVVLSLVTFLAIRDRIYVVVTSVVLGVLFFGLAGGAR